MIGSKMLLPYALRQYRTLYVNLKYCYLRLNSDFHVSIIIHWFALFIFFT